MFKQSLSNYCLAVVILVLSTLSYADVYKWVDDNGQTHYSQQAPRDQQAKIISTPPPPAIDADIAQQTIDTLIEKQNGTFENNEQQRQLAQQQQLKQQQRDEYCHINRNNLLQYQTNPGRRMIDDDGNVIAPDEQQRQQKIIDIQQRLKKHCQ